MEPSQPAAGRIIGLVLAAGAGTRMGQPKALMRTADGIPWVDVAATTLLEGGCAEVIVVLGAGADLAAETPRMQVHGTQERAFEESRRIVVAQDWAEGMSASLRAGLAAVADGEAGADAVLVTLVDLPFLQVEAVARMLALATGPASLARGIDGGRPAHPVLIGRDHWAPLAASLHGDEGARAYLRAHGAVPVDLTGLGGADDVDHPPA